MRLLLRGLIRVWTEEVWLLGYGLYLCVGLILVTALQMLGVA